MKPREFFPLGLAIGDVFFNRDQERAQLKQNLAKNQHTILVSPRRYGKTSLMLQVMTELDKNWVSGDVDFLVASDAEFVEAKILNCIGHVIPKLLSTHRKTLAAVTRFIASSTPKLVISDKGANIEFTSRQKPQETIIEALLGLDKIAKEENKRVVLLFDEFQQVGAIKNCEVIEASIRHAAERSQYVSYVFSGSNRHLLIQIFDDSARPLYHLCDKLVLDRISSLSYYQQLQACAKIKWGHTIEDSDIETILSLTHRHSYYTNLLCSRLWDKNQLPKENDIKQEWEQYVNAEQGRITYEIARLSANQRAVLYVIATETVHQTASKEFLSKVHLSSASAAQAINAMLEKDILFKDIENYFRVLDPTIEYYLRSVS